MKALVFVFLIFCAMNSYAQFNDHTHLHEYIVVGTDEFGGEVVGRAHSYTGDVDVVGRYVDDDGDVHEFTAQWDGYKQLSGETPSGETVDLTAY